MDPYTYCHERKDVMLFRVDRIRKLRRLDEDFQVPHSFSIENYMAGAWEVERGNPVKVTIRFDPAAAPLIREARWHPSQVLTEEPDGSLLSVEEEEANGPDSAARALNNAEVAEPQTVATSYPHLDQAEREALLEHYLGVTTWQAISRKFGLTLP
ncbi:MAG: WYL domain-containing protein [Symbiobacteriia bacterium]